MLINLRSIFLAVFTIVFSLEPVIVCSDAGTFNNQEIKAVGYSKAKKKDRRSKNPSSDEPPINRIIRPNPLPNRDYKFISEFVWSHAFKRDADIFPNADKNEISDYLNPNDVKPGDIIWVAGAQFIEFYENFFQKISNPFILILNGNPCPFDSVIKNKVDVDSFLKDPRVIHVFAQNCDYKGNIDKVSPLPIGINLHTAEFSERVYQKLAYSQDQENELKAITLDLKATNERIPRALIDFHLNDTMLFGVNRLKYIHNYFSEGRIDIFNLIKDSGVVDWIDRKVNRSDLWRTKGKYAFSVSPPGWGYDCYRTWEDLILGCIVVVKTSPLDPLFEGLPVVIIKDWSEINPENFEKWFYQYGDAFTNPNYREKLTHRYWMNKIRAKQEEFKAANGL